ncbi:hypothetical protein D8674_005931 [Pyrus ussuriensis x Pyrus communis]|uniref:Uncharacterized protein n=1 Tax=Pyrus ussuriensis x Pyrus communis TaxID=2448454 RepID=A0A5N5G6J2_9ROSA|nr:hypothetical protein D8674_005931 [Pyrus ussuriensis x Pyrus communis]
MTKTEERGWRDKVGPDFLWLCRVPHRYLGVVMKSHSRGEGEDGFAREDWGCGRREEGWNRLKNRSWDEEDDESLVKKVVSVLGYFRYDRWTAFIWTLHEFSIMGTH